MTHKQQERKDIWKTLAQLDPRYLYVTLAIILIIPIVRPFGLPIQVTSPTRDFYNIMKNTEKGDKVLIWGMMTLGWWPTEYKPGLIAVTEQLLEKGVKLYFISDGNEDPIIVDMMLEMIDKGTAKYGEDYVNLGFYAGGEVALSAFADDVHGLVKKDHYGTSVDQLPMMMEVKDATDFELLIAVTGAPVEMYLRQYRVPYGIPVGVIGSGGMAAILAPFYASGQAFGYVAGLRGGAEYETLVNKPGIGLASTDVISTGHLFFAAIMILTNVVYYVQRRKEQ